MMKNLILFIAASWCIITLTSFIARAFSQTQSSDKRKADSTSIFIKEIEKLKKKSQTLDDSIARYKEKDSSNIEERKEIVKANKVVGTKLKVAVRKADENLKLISQQANKIPVMYITVPKSREVLRFNPPRVEPLVDTIRGERTFWDKLFFRKKH
jgi:hypothetical protein